MKNYFITELSDPYSGTVSMYTIIDNIYISIKYYDDTQISYATVYPIINLYDESYVVELGIVNEVITDVSLPDALGIIRKKLLKSFVKIEESSKSDSIIGINDVHCMHLSWDGTDNTAIYCSKYIATIYNGEFMFFFITKFDKDTNTVYGKLFNQSLVPVSTEDDTGFHVKPMDKCPMVMYMDDKEEL